MKRHALNLFLATFVSLVALSFPTHAEEHQADIVIYGGTSAAITAAVQIKRMGKSVIIACPEEHLGGLSSGGLGWTDTGNKTVIGGLAREFYGRVYDHYDKAEAWKWQDREDYGNTGQGTPAIDGDRRTMWIFEPHVAEAIFEELVSEFNFEVHRDAWLDRNEGGVTTSDSKIVSFRTLDGDVYRAKMFIDATYEGDLMAAAGVEYTVGREALATYMEDWNGVQTGVLHHGHHFGVLKEKVDPYVHRGDPSSGVIKHVSTEPPGDYGTADHRVQAYCYRLCMSNDPRNRVPFPKPEGYAPSDYELMARIYEAGWRATLRKFDPIPNHKTDTNNHGPMSSDFIGGNYEYPEASYEEREAILEAHRRYQQGWLYFVSHDPRVPESTRNQMKDWGLAADEFTDNDNWPHQIYVREARRMVGPVVMAEHHIRSNIDVPKPVGMGSYTIDSHNVQRYITPEGHVQNEGDIGVHLEGPYSISYDALTPKKSKIARISSFRFVFHRRTQPSVVFAWSRSS
ncbi:MAG: FAD-dependent oxidoreductase [Planctomycetota bacterium]